MKISSKGMYYGKKKMELDSKGILLSEYQYDHPKTDWHYHENPYFMYVLQGNVLDINKKQKSVCPPGTLLLHNWNEQHYNTKESQTAKGFHVEFDRSWFEQKKLDISLWEGSSIIENPKMHHILAKVYVEFYIQDNLSEASIDLLLLQLCETTQNSTKTHFNKEPSWISQLKQLLHETNETISLDGLSAILDVHPAHISRAVPKYFKTTLGDYVRQEKIKKALPLLIDPKFSLTEIAHYCNFADQSHFTRTFKLYFQKTPKQFRAFVSPC